MIKNAGAVHCRTCTAITGGIKMLLTEKLKDIFAPDGILSGEMIGADYCHDEYPGESHAPEAVVEATCTEEVAALLRLCGGENVPVTVRGAGTGQAGGSVPVRGGVVLSLKGMDKILEFNEADHTLRVQPGVLLQDIKAEAEKHGLYYPPDPGEKTATIGGNAATNAAGPCAVKYGATADYIADAVIVCADGSVKKLSEMQNGTAVIGSEGTLGVITELTLKLIQKPGADAILLLPFMDAESCINAAAMISSTGCAPAVLEYMDTDIVEFSGNVTGNPVFPVEMDGERVAATLMAVLEGDDDDAVMEQMEAIAELAEDMECLDILVGDTPTMKRDMWAAHDAFHTSMESGAKSSFEHNLTVPTEKLAELLDFAKTLGAEKGLKVYSYAHIGSGGVHIHAASDLDKAEFKPLCAPFTEAVYEKCIALGGNVRGEYGFGYTKGKYADKAYLEAHAALKKELDPSGILNPGKVEG